MNRAIGQWLLDAGSCRKYFINLSGILGIASAVSRYRQRIFLSLHTSQVTIGKGRKIEIYIYRGDPRDLTFVNLCNVKSLYENSYKFEI